VVFSNQNGVVRGNPQIKDLQNKVDAIQAALDVPMQVYLATKTDKYRKPRTSR